jgi:hypothetical protein
VPTKLNGITSPKTTISIVPVDIFCGFSYYAVATWTMDLREIISDGVDWIDLAQDRDRWKALVNTIMNLWVSSKVVGGFSRASQLHVVRFYTVLTMVYNTQNE